MAFVGILIVLLVALACLLAGATWLGMRLIERDSPPAGRFATVNGTRMHYVHLPAGADADLPPILFIHGASANLNDQMLPLRPVLEDRAELLFLDRPGHGWSQRGPATNDDPFGQADTIAALMDSVGMQDAVVVGHSFGGAVAAAFALRHPDRTRGLVFLSAATHPWPGGRTSWYYDVAALPVIGPLFSHTVALPAGFLRVEGAAACVFAPNPLPDDYARRAAIPLVLRPSAFRANAIDVAGLYRHALATAPRYGEIAVPTVVVSGDSDTVVYEEIHSLGLARDIPDAELVWIRNLGHKPDWVAPELVAASIARVAGRPVDLQALAREVEARIATDHFNECPPEEAPQGELAPG